jgi:hypothetical protein
MYLDEIQEMLVATCGVNVSRTTVWRTLRRAGFTMKKVSTSTIYKDVNRDVSVSQVSRIAVERSAQKRLDYFARISAYQAHQLVFVDESSVDRRTTYRGRAWSIRGTQAQRKAFFVRGKRSVLEIPFE